MLQTLTQARPHNDAAENPAGLSAAEASISATPHREPVESIVSALGSDTARGLSGPEAQRRLDRYGPNQLKSAPETPWWRRLIEQFQNFLVIILLVATVISGIEWLLQDPRETALPYEAIVILAIVALNAMLGYFQEARAERSVRALMALAAPESTVIRDGERQRIPARDIVPGDIVLVEAGDKIPADARIVESANLHVDEAALTGESVPVTKEPQPIDVDVGLGDRRNMLFASTVATYGRGRAVIVATGMATQVGRIAGLLEAAEKEPTPLQQELDRTGKRLSAIMLGICAVVFATGLLSSPVLNLNAILSLFLFAVALAVAAIPEALPAIVTVGLSLGVRRMAAANAIVRKLPAVETLGAATVICSDKTGTLTRNEMTVRAIFTAGTLVEVGGSGYIPEGGFSIDGAALGEASPVRHAVAQTLRAAALANDAALVHSEDRWRVQGDPTEGALIVAARKLGIGESDLARFPRIAEIPFTSERKRHTTVHLDPGNPGVLRVFVKGAPEILFAKSRFAWEDGKPATLTEQRRAGLSARNEALAGQALRTLAIATRAIPAAALGIDPQAAAAGKLPSAIELPDSIEDDLVLLGLVGMIDPPRAEAMAAVAVAKRAHIRTVMITGDHPATAEAIARELEIFEPGTRTVTGVNLRGMSDAELDATVEQVRVFARVDPEHKLRIVGALQRGGHIVAMTGDGINDAPALKTANIGVAMGITGTDVSKEAADMVLTDDNFASIVKAIEEGRGIYDNIQKYLIYLLSTNSGELLTMFAGVMLAGVLGLVSADSGLFLPLLAVQLLWINLITDGPPALALGIDPKDHDVMMRHPRRRGSGVLLTEDWIRLACVGLLMTAGTLAVLDAYYPGGLFTLFATGAAPNVADEARARTMAFTTLMLFQLFDVYNCRSRRRSAFDGLFENKWLILAVAFSLFTHVLVIYVPVLQAAFHTVALSAPDWLVATGIAATLLIGMELAKLILRTKRPDPYAWTG
ncbi:cation-translocating P-type ATPase [Bradyrhizobium sediminis]|uniref:Cation-translocating P-type ATPase n=1 Tax=Bradyrhizobium sediminis TaxID=2840469 RepID=A0A975RXX5_9BRAD|nr:cation-translocating P-type ATPase [Bradyrhizobium sediminis]QWG24240.1 cation-translocating P-type ATPase [Bradyrhizobium sediminis]